MTASRGVCGRAPRRAFVVVVGALALATDARAGSGPWALSQDDGSVYFGADYTRWSRFAGGDGSFVGEPTEVGTAVTRTDVGGQVTYGLLPAPSSRSAWPTRGRA